MAPTPELRGFRPGLEDEAPLESAVPMERWSVFYGTGVEQGPEEFMSGDLERAVLHVIERARCALVGR